MEGPDRVARRTPGARGQPRDNRDDGGLLRQHAAVPKYRWIGRATSDDFVHWSKVVPMDPGAAPLEHLYTSHYPDPDLLIRTSGEMRVSNFLLWQISYSEFVVTPTFWPDFRKQQFFEALEEYGRRQRRFGGV